MKRTFYLIVCFSKSILFAQTPWLDQGTSFTSLSRGVNDINIVDADTIWVSAYDGTNTANYITEFSTSTDGGNNWNAGTIATGIIGAGIGNISAINSLTAWAAIFHPTQAVAGGIWKTIDKGVSWTQQSTAAFSAASFPDIVFFWDANNGIAIGDPIGGYFEVYTTTNGGTNWLRTPNTANQLTNISAEYAYINGFSVVGNTLWMGTNKGRIFKTTDKGLTFTNATAGNGITNVEKVSFSDLNLGYVAQHNTGNLTFKMVMTNDGGTTWTLMPSSKLILGADVCAIPGTNSLIAVGSDTVRSGSAISIDNGATWALMEDTLLHIQRLSAKFLNNVTGWAGGFNNGLGIDGISKFIGQPIGFQNYNLYLQNIELFPNPANNFISVSIKGCNGKQVSLQIFNYLGEKIYQEKFAATATLYFKQIDLQNFVNGVYFLTINDGENKFIKKFIKE